VSTVKPSSVKLSSKDQQYLDGECGEAFRMAMRIVVRMADVLGVEELMDISQAHIDGCGLLSDAGLEGGRVTVPTTLNMGPLDLQNYRQFGIDEEFAARAIRQGAAYTAMGCVPTWTCAPYQSYLVPRFGQQIAWGESNAVVYANSVLGARTNRYGDYMDICAAITGRVPRCGLHLTENRRGNVLFRLVDINPALFETSAFYAILGHYIGKTAGNRIPVIEGLDACATGDQLKAFCAAVASSGGVALFHAVGLTPEAATREQAFGGGRPETIIDVRATDLRAAEEDLSPVRAGTPLDLVILGCPHFSFEEFGQLAELVRTETDNGNTLNRRVRFVVITSQTSYALAQRADFPDDLEDFGAEITLDTCPFHTPMISETTRVIMTNSGKCSYYAPGELGVEVAFGTMADCVKSAVAGYVCRKELPWNEY